MFVAGIDVGSVAAKMLILREDASVASYVVADTNPDVDGLTRGLLARAVEEANLRPEEIVYTVGTGYGRQVVPFAQENLTEIMCHAKGVHSLLPAARTIIDIGGQDTKVIRVNETGRIVNFTMNTRCAAGTGRFTEVMARALGIGFEQWGEVVASAKARTKISNICTVFAESEVISKIMQKVPLNEILAGVCESIATRVYESVQRAGGVEPEVAFTGGVANNLGVRQLLAEVVGRELLIPDAPQSTGALGAARIALEKAMKARLNPPPLGEAPRPAASEKEA
ncbi:MAG: 2-hydroxyglutaryl-CoA dehydratase [Deltaproteobacteria bacterium]|nr:2-hydroxyglutaryl-CoA dehydratase [Deltaproteobacteria bacterium]